MQQEILDNYIIKTLPEEELCRYIIKLLDLIMKGETDPQVKKSYDYAYHEYCGKYEIS